MSHQSRIRLAAVALIALLPTVLPAQGIKSASSPGAAVEDFMRALADSNLTRMAELFGTADGPFARTKPDGYEKRIILMQLFLHGVRAHALNVVPGQHGLRTVTTQLVSGAGCKATIPFNVIQAKEGWLVHDFDLDAASQVNHPCERPGGNPER